MTHDSRSLRGQAPLTDALLWLVGAPAAALDSLYLAYAAPPLAPDAPETLVVWALAVLALALLSWNLLCSAVAHLATLRLAPPPLRRGAHALGSRYGTRLSKSLLARAGAGALIGSALITSAPLGAAQAAPQDTASPGVSLTWADAPGAPTVQQTGATEAAPASAPREGTSQDPPPLGEADLPDTVTVAPGDSLWSIAASLRPGSDDAHITRVWQAIHAANAHAITTPHLIYPGQQLSIPEDLP